MQNHIEKEAKILEINKKSVLNALKNIGAKKILDAITIIETYDIKTKYLFKKEQNNKSKTFICFLPIFKKIETLTKSGQTLVSQGAYLRLREEGLHSELILKYAEGTKNDYIKSEREISIEVKSKSEWKSVQQLLQQFGLIKIFYQEKKRESYLYKPLSLRFDIDTWPGVPTYVEIEGNSRIVIEKGATLIGYKTSNLCSAKAKEVFKKYSVLSTYMTFDAGTVRVNSLELLSTIKKILSKHGLSKKEIDYIANHYWEAELMGKKYHGMSKFCSDFQFYKERLGKPKVIRNNKAITLVDGNKEIGPLAVQFCIDMVVKKAKQYGIAIVGLKNFQRYGVLSTWTKEITKKNLIGIIINSTENFVTPPGGKMPVLGTNPISIGFPVEKSLVILDMATTKEPMSLVWYERSRGGILPKQTFLDAKGVYTTDPRLARWADVWGGIKGFNLSLMFQMLCGPLLGVKTQLAWEDSYQVGAIFIAIDPTFIRSKKEFKKDTLEFINFIREVKGTKKFLPGEHSHNQYKINKNKGFITLPKQVWGLLNLL